MLMVTSSRSRRATAAALVGVVVSGAMTGGCARTDTDASHKDEYCALLPDSVGLYVNNPVTQMGYPIGTVTSITPNARDVRVDFKLSEDRRLPADVKAIIRSTSILADRSLELVGNPKPGPELTPNACVPVTRSFTPKSLSEVIGSATEFINSINPEGSTNVNDVVRGIDQAIQNTGPGINELLTDTSAVVESPDQAIGDIGTIMTNLADLTTTLVDIRGPLKEVLLDAAKTTVDIDTTLHEGKYIFIGVIPFITLMSDLETELGDETQLTIDSVAAALRKVTPHSNRLANLLNPVPWWINTLANHVNERKFSLSYRPPLYRIRTPDGFVQCGIMNAQHPGSCANVAGQPYAVDVALLQYVFAEASR